MDKHTSRFFSVVFAVTALNAAAEGEWAPSTLSEATMTKTREAQRGYEQCLNEQLVKHLASDTDSRAVTDTILKTCEDRLNPIRAAFDAEKVPAAITDRYLRQQRSRAAQGVLREIMAAQAVRQAGKDASGHAP
jgi:hypothetical protein